MLLKGYLANDLFSEQTIMYNEYLGKLIRESIPHIDLYIPQENDELNNKSGYADSLTIFEGDNVYLDPSQLLFAVLDGPVVDDGVSAELGRFALLCEQEIEKFGSTKREILGLYTDIRQQGRDNPKKVNALIMDGTENQFMYRNLYVLGGAKKVGKVFSSSKDLGEYIKNKYGE